MDKYSKQMLTHHIMASLGNIQGQWHGTNDTQNPY